MAGGGFDIVSKFQDGGPVMLPILGLSVLAVPFTIERYIILFIQKAKLKPDKFLEALDASMRKNNGDKAKVADELEALCKKRGGVCADIMLEGLRKFKMVKGMNMGIFELKQWLNSAIEERARIALPQLESHMVFISIAATVAPLLGLFGTVVGMVQSFEVLASSAGGAKPDELAGGIAIALITTVGGLVVAMPSLIFFNMIKTSVENYVMLVEEAGVTLIDTLIS